MNLKRLIEDRIAVKAEERRRSKLEEAQERQAEEEKIITKCQNETEIKLVSSSLVEKKRKRQEIQDCPAKDLPIGDAPLPLKANPFDPSASTGAVLEGKPKPKKSNQFAPVPRSPRSKAKSGWKQREVIDTRRKPTDWYLNMKVDQKFSRGDVKQIAYVNTLITNCFRAVKNGEDGEDGEWNFLELRKRLHEMEFYPFLNGGLIKKSKVLKSDGLLQVFDGPHKDVFPWDLAADAEALWMRWMGGDFDCHLMRGVEVSKGVLESGKRCTSYRLETKYAQKKSPNVIGANNLTSGQWWPSRLCALRDGAHGEELAGIHGQTGKGAYLVVVAVGGYADEDHGESIEYCGTASETSIPTKSTALMIDSHINGQPLRVLRAVNKESKYAPKEGIRYDGLYTVTDRKTLDSKTAMFRFSLKRISCQDPIRYEGVEVRPTDQELKERMRIRKILE